MHDTNETVSSRTRTAEIHRRNTYTAAILFTINVKLQAIGKCLVF